MESSVWSIIYCYSTSVHKSSWLSAASHGSVLLVIGGADSRLHAGVTLFLTDRGDDELLNFLSSTLRLTWQGTSSRNRISKVVTNIERRTFKSLLLLLIRGQSNLRLIYWRELELEKHWEKRKVVQWVEEEQNHNSSVVSLQTRRRQRGLDWSGCFSVAYQQFN